MQTTDRRYRFDFLVFYDGGAIAVELDGHDYHKTKEQRGRDAQRDRWFAARKLTTVRFTGSQVYADPEGCVKELLDVLLRCRGASVVTLPAGSGFWATGRLSPYVLTGFNVKDAPVGSGAYVEVFRDGIAVWSKAGSAFARSFEEARSFLGLVTASYTLVSGVALDFAFTGWIEATKATFDGTMIGFVIPRGPPPKISTESKQSKQMQKAIEIAVAVLHRGPWRLAVRDVHETHLTANETDDAFVFAYRAIEDLARAFSTDGRKSWADLQAHLGTTEDAFKVERSDSTRHATPSGTVTRKIRRSSSHARTRRG